METSLHADPEDLARAAADLFQQAAEEAIEHRGWFAVAFSGGSGPWEALREFARRPVDWSKVYVFQVDERAAPDGSEERNWTHLTTNFLDPADVPPVQRHPMPVLAPEEEALTAYETVLHAACGTPVVFDLVHLGVGLDGHTASLLPGDPVLDVTDRDIAWSGPYQGTRRMTLTFPALARAKRIVWIVRGADKQRVVERLQAGDPSIPAGRVPQERATLLYCPA